MNLHDSPEGARLALLKPALLLTIVRHGQSEGNKKQLIQGQSDFPLSELGRRQADSLRQHLAERGVSFDAIYASDLSRAWETAEIVAAGQLVTTDIRLREKNYGNAQGQPVSQLTEAAAAAGVPMGQFVPPGGESVQEVRARGEDWFRELCERHLSDQCPRVLIASHGCFIRELLQNLRQKYTTNVSKADATRIPPNCAFTVLHVSRGQNGRLALFLLKLHSDEHLGDIPSTAPPPV